MDKLLEAAKKCLAEMDALQAAEKPDDAAIKGKAAEFDGIQAKIEGMKAATKRRRVIADAERDNEIDTEGKDLRDPAQPRDHGVEAQAKEVGFWDYMQGKELSGNMRRALAPTSESFKADHPGFESGVSMPDGFFASMFGRRIARLCGKALPMSGGITGTVASGSVQTVPPDFRALLLELPPEPAYILQRANVVPAPYGSVFWPILRQADPQTGGSEYGGVTGQWISEGATKPDTEVNIDQLKVSTYEYAAYTELTNRLLARSAIQLEPLLTRLFRDKIMDALDTAFLVGTGIGQPEGVVTNVGIRVVSRNIANQIGYVDLVNLEHVIEPYHRKNAIWAIQDTGVRNLRLQVDGNNRPLWIPYTASAMGEGIPASISGREYIDTIRLPALGQRGDIVLGDWSQYIVAMEQEAVIMRSEHYKFKNNVTAFRVSVVVGGKVAQPRAFSILDRLVGSTTNTVYSGSTTPVATTTV